MKTIRTFLPTAILAAFVLAPATLVAQQPSLAIANQLGGYYEGVGPANHLKLTILPGRPVADVPDTFRFDVTILGTYEKNNVNLSGTLAVAREGDGVRINWSKEDGGRCDTHLSPAGDGFEGKTLAGSCQTAFQYPVSDSWSFETEPGTIVVKSDRSGETLRFRKTAS